MKALIDGNVFGSLQYKHTINNTSDKYRQFNLFIKFIGIIHSNNP